MQFVKVKNTPGFSHRVVYRIVNPSDDSLSMTWQALDWLGDGFKPRQAAACYFYHKHTEKFAR